MSPGPSKRQASSPSTSRHTHPPISPPPLKRRKLSPAAQTTTPPLNPSTSTQIHTSSPPNPSPKILKSPFSLTHIHDLPPDQNIDCVSLSSILGDPLIREAWIFNYLHDIDFMMSHLDPDVEDAVKIHIIHGFWKQDDPNRLDLCEAASHYKNITLHSAFMPEIFGTHHSKMFILIRHDDTAQVIIHTANMIERDWRNMTQGVWCSPLLPLASPPASSSGAPLTANPTTAGKEGGEYGTGERFKHDLLNYLEAYDRRRVVCKPLRDELRKYSFDQVKGALVASVPGRFRQGSRDHSTPWGLQALTQVLSSIDIPNAEVREKESGIIAQISSVATLGPTDSWIKQQFTKALSTSRGRKTPIETKVVFPTAGEIRRSLDGYDSGGSIHWKIQSVQQQKQLTYMKPMLHHWANDDGEVVQSSGRDRAAPHIKTYIRYNGDSADWALLTSANMSKQAWGDQKDSEIRIASWEIGVLVWPGLFSGKDEKSKMVPTFQRDTPRQEDLRGGEEGTTVIGLRMPYSLPLKKYGKDEVPWVVTTTHTQPDWRGATWVP